jgi:hypothetical protein
MGLIREPKEIDFSMKSEPWTDEELGDFRQLMAKLKSRKPKTGLKVKEKNILTEKI